MTETRTQTITVTLTYGPEAEDPGDPEVISHGEKDVRNLDLLLQPDLTRADPRLTVPVNVNVCK